MSASPRQFSIAVFDQIARLGKAVASPQRLRLLEVLSQGPRTVETLAAEIGLSVANASQHLQILRAARLLQTEKAGLHVTYSLADPLVVDLLGLLRRLAERRLTELDAIVRDFFADRSDMEPVDLDTLCTRAHRGEVSVIDVRPTAEFAAGHIPGALSVPLAELDRRLAELPKDREIVAYCRGPYCVMAVQAVEALRARGFRARRCDSSIHDWRSRGLSVAVGGSE
ncbi:MAG: metalloregulator ArsR/SmtB family transcription factor [Candidatus Schekmanbacteria bacterium]|nr:metalloregulator ArsR/SmtB family transcription factor [Candidatus Schekmanbacteria bacterium]